MLFLRDHDPEIADLLRKETVRQAAKLELAPSANTAPPAVLEALSSAAGNKAAEGYPGRRGESGCEFADALERLSVGRARTLFGAEYANVQPHSGTAALAIAYQAFLQPGDTVLAMRGAAPAHGGARNFSARTYFFVTWDVDPQTELIDYTQVHQLARRHRPRLIVAGSAAYPRQLDWRMLRAIADEVKAVLLADLAPTAGLVAGRALPSPVAWADCVAAATHATLRGPRGGLLLARTGHADRLDRATCPGVQGAAHLGATAAKAVAFRVAATAEFAAYATQVVKNAARLAAELGGLGWALASGGTDTHLVVLKLAKSGLAAAEAERRLDAAGITAARCALPGAADADPPGGLLLGTAAITSRGMKESQVARIARFVHDVLSAPTNDATRDRIRGEVADLFQEFPRYRELLA